MNIKSGQLYKSIRSFYSTYDFSIMKPNTIVMVVETDSIGNVFYLIGDRKSGVDTKTFQNMFTRVDT